MSESSSQIAVSLSTEDSNSTEQNMSLHTPCKSASASASTNEECSLSSETASSSARKSTNFSSPSNSSKNNNNNTSNNNKTTKETPKETPKESPKESAKDSPAFSLRPRRSTPKPDLKSPSFTASSSTQSPKYSIFTKNPSLLESRRFSPQSFEVVKRKLFRLIAKNEGIPCDEDEDFVPIDSKSISLNPSTNLKNVSSSASNFDNPSVAAASSSSITTSKIKSEGNNDQGDSTSDSTTSGSLLAGYTKVKRHRQRTTIPLKPVDSIKTNIDLCIFSRKISIHQITCHFESPSACDVKANPAKSPFIYYDKHYLTLKVIKILKPITVTRMIKIKQDDEVGTNFENTGKISNEEPSCNIENDNQIEENYLVKSENESTSNEIKYDSINVECLIVLTQEINVSSPLIQSSSNSGEFDSTKQILPIYFYSEYSNIDLKPGQALEITKFVAHEPQIDSLEEINLQQCMKNFDHPLIIGDDDGDGGADSESSNLTIICEDSTDGNSSSSPSTRSKRKRRKVSHGNSPRSSCDEQICGSKNTPNKLTAIRIMVDEFWQTNQLTSDCLSLVMDSKVITEPNESYKINEATFKLVSFAQLDDLEVKSSLLRQVKEYQQKSSFAPSVITLSDPRGDKYCNDRINKDHSQIHSRIPFISIKDKIVSVENPLLLKVNTIGKRKEVPSPGLRFTSKIIKESENTGEK